MQKIVSALVVAGLLLTPCLAEADHIGIYNDTSGSQCHLEITPPVQVSVYLVHIYTLGTTGSRLKVVDLTGMVPLSVTPLDTAIILGDIFLGADVGYGGCFQGHIAVARLDFFAQSPPARECDQKLRVVAHPDEASPIVADCVFNLKPATGGEFVFGPWYCSGCSANPTEQKTWGRIKSLYR